MATEKKYLFSSRLPNDEEHPDPAMPKNQKISFCHQFNDMSLEPTDDIQGNNVTISNNDVKAPASNDVESPRIVVGVSTDSLSMKQHEYAIVRFLCEDYEKPLHNKIHNIELPLQITSNDLIIALESAYHLGIDLSDTEQCYLSCEYPIVLLKGNRTLAECGVRNASLITFKRR